MNENAEINELNRLQEAQSILSNFIDALQSIRLNSNFSTAVNDILNCKGKVVCCGMGKNGIAMKKFAATLCSLGFPACFLHPGEAQHGDLGLLQENDILFISSTSGKTREVYELIDLAKKSIKDLYIIGLTSHPDSPIRGMVNLVLDMGTIKEAGHLSLAPSTSILVILAITDALSLVAAKEKELTKEQYGVWHHGGYLGLKAQEK
jgi:arabinose-5-phosphate isomerase